MSIIKRFFDYTEITTKIASVFPFLVTLGYCFFLNRSINAKDSVLFFVAMLLFDMTVTMINNYTDRNHENRVYFSQPVMLAMIFCGVVFAALIGLYLSWIHGTAFLLAGIFCFVVGIAYTFGPAPISRSPYGEVFSGFTMGFVLPFLAITINAPPLVTIEFTNWNAVVSLDLPGLLKLAFVCIPLIFCIANIMLANNICDIETDKSFRYTMARHIGRDNALRLFAALYVFAYLGIIAAFIMGAIPWPCLLVLVTAIWVYKNVKRFRIKQTKSETFVLSTRNHLIILIPYTILMFLGALL